jgi:tetratricopeptide (TPR) repeat protein
MNLNMKTRIFKYCLFFFALLVFNGVAAQTPALQDSLNQAAKSYNSGKYNEAIRTYENVLGKGFESPVLYFNLGNAYYKAGNSTYAILNFERAKKLSPNDEDINYNLEMAKKKIVDNIVSLPQPGFLAWWKQLISIRSADQWGIHSLVAFFIFLILFGVFLFSSTARVKKLAFWFSIAAIFYSGVTFSFADDMRKKLLKHNSAVITERSVRVKGSPSETGTELFIIHEGLTVQLTDQLGDWIEIRLPDGNKGWVKEAMMIRI